jgi:hypothetical protein
MEPTIDARTLVTRLCHEAERDYPSLLPIDIPPPWTAEHIRHREELGYLNRHWILETEGPPRAGGGLVARLRHLCSRFVHRIVRRALAHYLLEERDLLANLVRFQNTLAERGDLLLDEAHAFRDRVRAQDARIVDELAHLVERDEVLHRALEQRIEALEQARGG